MQHRTGTALRAMVAASVVIAAIACGDAGGPTGTARLNTKQRGDSTVATAGQLTVGGTIRRYTGAGQPGDTLGARVALAGARIELTLTSATDSSSRTGQPAGTLQTASSAGDGSFTIRSVVAGTYVIRVVEPGSTGRSMSAGLQVHGDLAGLEFTFPPLR